MSQRGDISIPIVREGKDICRIIFAEGKGGRFDIKIECLGNPYSIAMYRLFQIEPEFLEVDNPEKTSITYHHGKEGKKVVIHLKNEEKKEKYKNILSDHVLPPNRNMNYPIPLFKIEIPKDVSEKAKEYRKKKKHKAINIESDNVVEMYMAAPNFDLGDYFSQKYAVLFAPHVALSIEYFATYTVVTDYSKSENLVPTGRPEIRVIGSMNIPSMKVFIIKYKWPKLDSNIDKIRITFIENELAEEILLCTLIRYPGRPNFFGLYDKLLLGAANIGQLAIIPNHMERVNMIPVLPNSTVAETLRRGNLNPGEMLSLLVRAAGAREKLYCALLNHQKNGGTD